MRDIAAVDAQHHRHSDLHGNGFRHGVRDAARDWRLTKRAAVNALAGLIFGLRLLISGMANPLKVQNFLDLAGTFDLSLIFVMIGRIAVTFGWGVSGFCPGPAITLLPLLAKGTFIFVPAMLIGIGVARLFTHADKPLWKSRRCQCRRA